MRKCILLFILICTLSRSMAQPGQAAGKITDSIGNPIFKASVREVGTNKGTTSDANGFFDLRLTKSDRIVISSVGYFDKEIAAGTGLQIVLTANQSTLNEVV